MLPQGEDSRLVAYGVRAAGSYADARTLREACEAELPYYMVPAAYVMLEELPLTMNGKLNVAALPEPDADALPDITYVAPRNAIEQRLCVIWEQVLEVGRVASKTSSSTSEAIPCTRHSWPLAPARRSVSAYARAICSTGRPSGRWRSESQTSGDGWPSARRLRRLQRGKAHARGDGSR